MVISLVGGIAVVFLNKRQLWWAGGVSCAVAAGVLLALCLLAVTTWPEGNGPMTASMLGFRIVFVLATATYLPVVQVGLAGIVLLLASRTRDRTREVAS
jgi:hypothetical protein